MAKAFTSKRAEKPQDKKPKKEVYRVVAGNIYIGGIKRLKNDSVELSPAEAKEILDGDKAVGRKARIAK